MGKGLGEGALYSGSLPSLQTEGSSLAAPLPPWRAVIRCSDLKASKGEEELGLPGTVSTSGPASVHPCTFLKMKTLEWACVNS